MHRFVRAVLFRRLAIGWLPNPQALSPAARLIVLSLTIVSLLASGGASARATPASFFKLINSELVAAKPTIAPGEELLFTVILRNDATTADSIDVTVQHPTDLAYVSDSAAGATYDASNRAISWAGIAVAGGGEAQRTFKLRMAGTVSSDKNVQVFAAIAGEQEHIIRLATVTLKPGSTPPPETADLSTSSKRASLSELGPGEQTRYAITLRNTGTRAATVNVIDPLPAELSYVGSSVEAGGSYNDADRTVRWDNIAVAANATVELAFRAQAPATISAATNVVNTATIEVVGSTSFTRSVTVQLKPTTTPTSPRFDASVKLASRYVAQPDQSIDYQIVLYNNGTADGTVDVTDQLPSQLSYVDGTASAGASFDTASNTLTWKGVIVQIGQQVTLSYTTHPTGTIDLAVMVENTAEIDVGSTTLRRSVTVLLVPDDPPPPPDDDVSPPSVDSLTIGDGDVLTDRNTTVQIQATDNVGVEELFLREWVLVPNRGLSYWRVVQSSGWIDYQPEVAWQLGGDVGTHYIGVWARDAAGNVSTLDRKAVDFASLVVPDTSVARGYAVIYQVYYPAGVAVTATTTPRSGDVDLYVWYPKSMLLPDEASTNGDSAVDTVAFTTPTAGMYIFAAVGYTDAYFDITINEPGGSRPAAAALGLRHALVADSDELTITKDPPDIASLLNNSIDPLGSVSALTTDVVQIALPLVVRQ